MLTIIHGADFHLDAPFAALPADKARERRGEQRELLNNIDVLIDGPFLLAERTLEARFRGSRNQRIINVPQSLREGKAVLELSERWGGGM